MKKIFLIILLCSFVVSCGKKNDPIYKEQKSKVLKMKKLINS